MVTTVRSRGWDVIFAGFQVSCSGCPVSKSLSSLMQLSWIANVVSVILLRPFHQIASLFSV